MMVRYAKHPDFQDVEVGNYPGRCYRIIEIGTTHDEFGGKPRSRNRLMISFELPTELMSDGRPFSVTWWTTASLHEKAALRIGLQTWRRKPFTEDELDRFHPSQLIGVPGMVTVDHTKTGKAFAKGVGPLPKGMTCPPAINPPQTFFLDEWSDAAFEELPDGIKKIIRESDEYKAIMENKAKSLRQQMTGRKEDDKDDVPWVDEESSTDEGNDIPF
jgi:hypothetical protein